MNDAPENDIVIFSHFSSKWQIKLFRKMEYCQDHEIYSLGMIAVQGSLPSEEAIKLIDAHLAAFKLDRNVTVCIANLTAVNWARLPLLPNFVFNFTLLLFRITIISIFFSPLHNIVINREWKMDLSKRSSTRHGYTVFRKMLENAHARSSIPNARK